MAQRQHISPGHDPNVLWLPEDTEESILGTDLHQTVIRELANGLVLAAGPEGRWAVGSQTRINGFRRHDGSVVPLYPDIFVYTQQTDPLRASRSLAVDGPPLLIVEVASDSTWAVDVNAVSGKAFAYGAAGVREYLAFDPTEQFIRERVRAWRQGDNGFVLWQPDSDGRWHSDALSVSFAVESLFLRVYTQADGRIPLNSEMHDVMHRSTEVERRNAEVERRNAEVERRNAALEREVEALRRRLKTRQQDDDPAS